MNKQKSIKKNVALNLLRTVAAMFFPLITFPYSSRILGPLSIGKVNFAQSIISYFSIIAGLGITSYGIRGCAKIRAEDDNKEKLNQFSKELFTINMISTFIAYGLLFISIFVVPKFYEYRKLLIVLSVNILFTTIGMDWLYSAVEDFFYITIRSVLFQFLSMILLFLLVKKESDYLKYALISVISNGGSNIFNFIHSKKYISFKNCDKLDLKKHLKPILILFISSIAISIFSILDTSMIGFLSNTEEVGYYSAAAKIIRIIRDLFPAMNAVLFSRFSYYIGSNEIDKIYSLTDKTLNFIFCFALPIIAGLIILMPTIINLFCGPLYLPSIKIAQVMSFIIVFSSFSGFISGNLLLAFGRDKLYLIIEVGAAILDVLLNFIFIPKGGALGASIATLLTEFFMFITYVVFSYQILKKIKLKKSFFQYLIGTIIMGSIVFLVKNTLIKNSFLQLIVCFILGVFVYALILFLFKNTFFMEILNFIRKKIKR